MPKALSEENGRLGLPGAGTENPLHTKAMKEVGSKGTFWILFATATVLVIILAAVPWSLAHPFGIHWDEAQYFNEALIDVQRLQNGKLLTLGRRILLWSGGIPPAYRILAVPFLALFGFHTTTARFLSMAWFVIGAIFVYLATRRIASRAAGAFAVLIFVLSPEVVSASIFFGTDTSLYLATSAMLYYLFVCWSDGSRHSANWIGLGLSIGLGFLSKVSFIPIAVPVLGYWLIRSRYGKFHLPSLALHWKAGALAFLVAAPWWSLNYRSAMTATKLARDFVRHSLGPPSLATWTLWLSTVLQCLLGHGVSIVIGVVLITCFIKLLVSKVIVPSPLQKAVLGACVCAGTPLVFAQLCGTNHLLRHISPAVIPLAIAVGILFDAVTLNQSKAYLALCGVLFGAQLLMIVSPVLFPNNRPVDLGFVTGGLPWRVMVRFDQWDWRPVKDIGHDCGIENPKISFLGSGRAFDPPQIQYPWVAAASSTREARLDFPEVTWLWRYEDGALDWQKVMNAIGHSDMVLTAPHYVGEVRNKEDLDNQYNGEFADRLAQDSRFRGPIRIAMGRFEPVEVMVFLKKTLACH